MEPREIVSSVGLPLGAAVLGSVATMSGTKSHWYESLEKPAIQPPPAVFPIAWTALYTQSAIASGIAQKEMSEADAAAFRKKFLVNMALNAGWCWSFFGAKKVVPSIAVAGALAASSIDLTRSAAKVSTKAGGLMAPYAAWTSFATVLNAAIWRKNPRRD